jgi:hypothetical protein
MLDGKTPLNLLFQNIVLSALIALILSVTLLFPATTVIASTSLQIKAGILKRQVKAGETIEHTFTVQSSPTDPELEMIVEAAGFGQALDGSYQALPPGEDTSPRSAREFITGIDKPSFILNPGPSGAQQVTARIKVPQNITAGGYYAIIYVHSQPAGEGQVGIVLAANIPVVLNVGSAGQTATGEILEVTTGKVEAGKPIEVATVFKNTGNYHYKARNRIIISDGAGNQVAEASVPLTAASIIPGYGYRFEASLIISEGLEEGEYQVNSEVIGEDGAIKDTHETTLEIGESVDKDNTGVSILPEAVGDNFPSNSHPFASSSNFNTRGFNTYDQNNDHGDIRNPILPANIFKLMARWLETLSSEISTY